MKTKRTFKETMPIALEVVHILSKYVTRIEIAGSLRRKCATIGDIEIMAIPARMVDLFGDETEKSLITTPILEGAVFIVHSGGEKYKKLIYKGFQVDLFLQTPETWGMNMMIRTGPLNFSRRMVTRGIRGSDGFCPSGFICKHARVHHVKNTMSDDYSQPLATPEEPTSTKVLVIS